MENIVASTAVEFYPLTSTWRFKSYFLIIINLKEKQQDQQGYQQNQQQPLINKNLQNESGKITFSRGEI